MPCLQFHQSIITPEEESQSCGISHPNGNMQYGPPSLSAGSRHRNSAEPENYPLRQHTIPRRYKHLCQPLPTSGSDKADSLEGGFMSEMPRSRPISLPRATACLLDNRASNTALQKRRCLIL